MGYYVNALKNYATFSGRARRKEYWMFALFNGLIAGVLYLLAMLVPVMGILYGIYALALIIPSLAVFTRRLHDIDKSAWWILISLVPIVGGIVILVFACTEGTQGPNQYGEDPKNEFGTQL